LTAAKQRRNLWVALGFLLPNFFGFLLFTAGPVVFTFGAAFTNWDIQHLEPFRFTALDNFITLFGESQFWLYLVNTLYFLLGMPFAVMGSLFIAVLLSQKLKGIVVYRTLLYLPSVTSGVAVMIMWKALYNPEFGPVNALIEGAMHLLGIGSKGPSWLQSTQNLLGLGVEHVGFDRKQFGLGAREAIIFMGVWGALGGGNMLLYLAALGNVPKELTEAAELDGAIPWKVFWSVTWPQLAPTTFFIVVMSFIGGLQGGFEQARVMTNGGPAGTTTTLAYYIYNKAFVEYQMGYASAVSLVLFAIVLGVTAMNWKFGNKEVSY